MSEDYKYIMMKILNIIVFSSLVFLFSNQALNAQEPERVEEKKQVEKKQEVKKEKVHVTEIKRSEFEKLPLERQKIIENAPDYKVVEDKKINKEK